MNLLRFPVSHQANCIGFSVFLHMYNLAKLFGANIDSSSGKVCQALCNQHASIGLVNETQVWCDSKQILLSDLILVNWKSMTMHEER